MTLPTAQAGWMNAVDEYVGAFMDAHGNNVATKNEALARVDVIHEVCKRVVEISRDLPDADPETAVQWLINSMPDERALIGWGVALAKEEWK